MTSDVVSSVLTQNALVPKIHVDFVFTISLGGFLLEVGLTSSCPAVAMKHDCKRFPKNH